MVIVAAAVLSARRREDKRSILEAPAT
jgi:hypothetical protein